jgi:RNA polymerase sigma factor (sigma-70 family)
LREIQTLFGAGSAAGLTDGQLLERFADRRGEGSEAAFSALMQRHGPMVLRVCREALRDTHAAEDAFQATFLVLARRAGAIRKTESVGPWLYGVALRVASCARASEARRRARDRRGARMDAAYNDDLDRRDDGPAIHEEIGRLPEKYRAAVVLCYLEGLTHEQAARQLGWPVGTVRTRLSWAREKL